jgi:tetratricopeptide (TPR) repeat protein
VAAAEVFIYENKIAEAQSCLNDAVKVLDNGFELGHAYFLTGTIHFENNDFISAKKDYEMAIKNGYVDANYELAEINFFTDNYHSATDCYLQAYKYLTNERKKIITLYALIDLALIEKNYQLIIKYLYMIIQLKDYRALDLAAHIFSGDYSFAIGMLIDEKNQDDIKNVLLAKLYICKGEFSLARNLCQKLVEKQINCAYCLLGNISEINKNAEDAKNYYLQGANLKDCYTLNYLANAALSSQQIDKALIYYLQSCELADPDGIMQTALIYGRLAKFDQAADLYKRAINIVNRNDLKNVYFNLAIAYAKIGKNELIVPTFVKAF